MKHKRTICFNFILLLTFHICFGQNLQNEALLYRALTDGYCSEDLVSTLDSFMVELQNNPSSQGYIIFQGKDSQEGKNIRYFETLKSHIKDVRKFDPDRVIFLRAGNAEQMVMQFWLVPKGSAMPKSQGEYTEKKIESTTRFDVGWADWHKWNDSEWTIYSYSFVDWGCEIDVNMRKFAEILAQNIELNGYLVIYNDKTKAKKVARFAIKELVEKYKLPRKRISVLYAKRRDEPQIELWLVPRKETLSLKSLPKLD